MISPIQENALCMIQTENRKLFFSPSQSERPSTHNLISQAFQSQINIKTSIMLPTTVFEEALDDHNPEADGVTNVNLTSKATNRYSILRNSTALPVAHKEEGWHEANNIWEWQRQARIIIMCQKAHWIVFPPSIFIHYLLKRDWGMALGPLFAFAIYGDVRSLDLFLAASLGGVICGVFKHLIRSPRPFWIIPDVFLKEGTIMILFYIYEYTAC